MRVLMGTSGFSYSAWKGSFYPAKLPAKDMLRFYAERFPAVEVNNTFYRLPKQEVLEGWTREVPADFAFAVKASQRLTHILRMKDAGETLTYFLSQLSGLGDHLGPVLYQLPPNMKKDLGRLVPFLELLPRGGRSAFEFRHASWFDDEVYAALREHGAALCVADDEKLSTPRVATAGFGYLRLRRPDYTSEALADWLSFVKGNAWTDAFVFFKHEDEARGPAYAVEIQSLL